ncbi:MAG TPA: hydrogenase [Synergistaceae bacterium]|nr:hydrogenase [Synergistaceae bacterium]
MWGVVHTGFGSWDALAWILFFGIAAFFLLWFRSLGRSDYKKGTDQDEIFWSSNVVPEDGAHISVPADAAYWGFRKGMEPFYKGLVGMHTGLAPDIVGWYVVVVAIMSVLILIV